MSSSTELQSRRPKGPTVDRITVASTSERPVVTEVDSSDQTQTEPRHSERPSMRCRVVGSAGTSSPFDVLGGALESAVVAASNLASSTAPIGEFTAATLAVRQALGQGGNVLANDEESRDRFVTRLESLVRRYGALALEITGRVVLLEGTDPKTGLSALRAAGNVRDVAANETRRLLAENALHSRVPELRYGALHVLADIGDTDARAKLAEAEEREAIGAIRADIRRLRKTLGD